jgi:peptidoglycan/LPS O-acetylase OafA/YrhL
MGLSAEERAHLRSNVERRQAAPARWVLLAMLVGFGALAAIFAARGGTSELSRPWNVVVPLLPFALLLALATPLLIRVRRRTATPLVEGADADTRRAVTRAIRAGSAADPRIDDLVADLRAQGTPRQLGLVATIQFVGALGVGAAAVVGDEPMVRILLALAAVAMLTAAGLLLRRRRQLLAYRPGTDPSTGPVGPAPDGPPAAAKGD